MISTASYPARTASPAARAKSVAVRSTPRVDRALGRNGVIGDLVRDAETLNGW